MYMEKNNDAISEVGMTILLGTITNNLTVCTFVDKKFSLAVQIQNKSNSRNLLCFRRNILVIY